VEGVGGVFCGRLFAVLVGLVGVRMMRECEVDVYSSFVPYAILRGVGGVLFLLKC
jgi:hypothetical protein